MAQIMDKIYVRVSSANKIYRFLIPDPSEVDVEFDVMQEAVRPMLHDHLLHRVQFSGTNGVPEVNRLLVRDQG